VQCLLEVVTINDELLWALLGAEDIHHLAKANHVHGHCSRAAAVDVGHLWKHQLLTLHTTCAHSFALDLTVSLYPLGLFTFNFLRSLHPLGLFALVFLCSMCLLGLCIVMQHTTAGETSWLDSGICKWSTTSASSSHLRQSVE